MLYVAKTASGVVPIAVSRMSTPIPDGIHRFRLFVAGDARNAAIALANLTSFCHAHLADRHVIEIVDVFREPERSLADGIVVTPTLVRLSPLPVLRIIGTLDDIQTLLLEAAES